MPRGQSSVLAQLNYERNKENNKPELLAKEVEIALNNLKITIEIFVSDFAGRSNQKNACIVWECDKVSIPVFMELLKEINKDNFQKKNGRFEIISYVDCDKEYQKICDTSFELSFYLDGSLSHDSLRKLNAMKSKGIDPYVSIVYLTPNEINDSDFEDSDADSDEDNDNNRD